MPKWVTPAVQVLGATAGLAALATFVGGAMLWLRFDGLHLPADRAVALLPNELLLIVGAQALMLPVALGLGALLWLAVIDPLDSEGRVETRFWTLFMPVVAALMVVIVASTDGLDVWVIAIAVAAALVGALLIFRTAVRTELVRNIAWTVFGVFALLGALVNVLEMRFEPRMEPVAALMQKDDSAKTREGERGLAGFFVGETPERLWFVSLPGNGDPGDPFADAAVDRVVGIPRSQVTRIAMREPAGVGDEDSGREQAHTLLAELQVTVLGEDRVTQPVTTTNPEAAFAPLVHLHSDEEWLPMSARGFIDESVLGWSNRGGECKSATIAAGAARARSSDVTDVPRIRDERLGPTDPHAYEQPANCAPRAATYRATQLTRPYHGKSRPQSLLAQQGFYLDLRDDAREGHDDTSDEGPRTLLRDVPVYVDTEPVTLTSEERDGLPQGETAGGGLRFTYWMLYGLSEPPGPDPAMDAFVHEGDWERISVRVARLGEGESNRYLPLSARYFYHNHSRKIPWYAVRRVVGGTGSGQGPTHPVAYSAEGSHASYWRAGRYEAVYEPKGDRLLAVDDNAIACPDCPQWHTWKLVLPARAQLWYGFGGAWGKVGASGDTTGPLGPSEYKLEVEEDPTTVLVGEQQPLPTAPADVEEAVGE